MALTKIQYTNKETLNAQPSIADKNKCTSGDLNEIKSVVNNAIDQIDTNTSDISSLLVALPLKLLIDTHGQTSIELPQTWSEVIILSTLDGDAFRCLSFVLPYGSPTGQYLRLSYYGDASDNANVGYLYGADNKIQLIWYNIGGAGQTLSNVRTQVYYR